jgi:hypothetical protein
MRYTSTYTSRSEIEEMLPKNREELTDIIAQIMEQLELTLEVETGYGNEVYTVAKRYND